MAKEFSTAKGALVRPVVDHAGRRYGSVCEAAADAKVCPSLVWAACRGFRREAGGRRWRWARDEMGGLL